jgi:hypothetical protein
MAKIDIQNIFKTKKFTELNNKEKISWIDHFFGDDRDEDTDPNPWDAAFGVGADSTSLIPGTDSMSQYDYFLDEMWNLRTKLIKQKPDTVSSIKPSPEVSSVIDSVDSGTIGTSYPGSPLQDPQKLNNIFSGPIGRSYGPGSAFKGMIENRTDAETRSGIGSASQNFAPKQYTSPQLDFAQEHRGIGSASQAFTPEQISNSPISMWDDTNDQGERLNSDFEGNYGFEALRDIAVNKNNTQAYNKPFNGEVSRDNTSQPRMMQTENGLRPMTEQEMYESNKYNASQKILALTGQDDESIARAKAQPIVKPDTTISDGKMGLLGGQPTIPFETLEDTPKPNLDRLGNVIEDDSGKNWFADKYNDIADFSQDTVDYFKDTSWEDMQDDFVDSASDLGEWATANPWEAASYGLMLVPGVGWVGGTALKIASAAGKVVTSPISKIATKAVNTTKAKQPLVKLKELIVGRAPAAKNPYVGMRGAPTNVPNTAAFRAAQETTRLNKLNAASKAKELAKAKIKAEKLAGKIPNDPTKLTKSQMFNNAATRIGGTGVVATTVNKELFDGGKDSAIGNVLRGEVFGNKNVVASELGTSINPTIDATVNNMTQAQVDSLPSAGQDWWTALEEQDAQQMQAIRDYEIRAAAQQNVKAKTTLEDVPIDFGPFGPDFHQRDGTNVWTKFRNY